MKKTSVRKHEKFTKGQNHAVGCCCLNTVASLVFLFICHCAVAADNRTFYVEPDSPVTPWRIDGGELVVLPGGKTLNIRMNNSVLNMDRGTATIDNSNAATQTVTLQRQSQAIINNSFISNVQTGRSSIALGVNGGSQAIVNDTILQANGRGFTISGANSTLNLYTTTSTGFDNGRTGQFDGGQGGSIFDGTLTATDSIITGDRNGLRFVLDEDTSVPTGILNNTTVKSNNSSAIVLGTVSSAYSNGTIVLQVNKGSQLIGGNNTIIEVIGANTGNITIDNSQLAGNIIGNDAATVNVLFKNKASLQGSMQNINTLNMDNSQISGDITGSTSSATQVTLKNKSAIRGDIRQVAFLNLDSSQISGNITGSASSAAQVALKNKSAILGDLRHVSSLNLDSSQISGNITGSTSSAAQVALKNKSVIRGDLLQLSSLNVDNSQINGNITGDTLRATSASLSNRSVVTGTLSDVHTLAVTNSQLVGNAISDGTSGSVVTLNNQATVTGDLQNYDRVVVSNGALWKLVQSAKTGDLALNNGRINLNSTGANYRTLTTNSLSGTGRFLLRTNIADMTGDRLVVKGNAEGNHLLVISNTGAEPLHNNPLTVVNTAGGNGVFTLPNGAVDAGVYEYKLIKQDNDWALLKTEEVTPSVETILSVFNATPAIWNGEMRTVRGRLGDLRMTANQDGGVWAQYLGQQTNVTPRAGNSYKQKQFGLMMGADKSLDIQNGHLLAGVFTGYSDNSIDATYGNGNIDSFYLGAYATWLSDSGWFIDTLLKGNRFTHDIDARMSNGDISRGNYHNYGTGLSFEMGKNIRLHNNWFIEPSLQLTSLWVSGNHYTLDNGMEASNASTRSKQAALNLIAGKDIMLRNSFAVTPYVKASYQYEFARDNKVHINDVSFSNDMSGGNGVYGVGVNAPVSSKAYVYAGVDYAKGPKSESPWAANIGVRINW